MKILIADDSTLSLHLLESILTKWGYEVITTKDGNEAWRILSQDNHPKLAILDWIMPGFDGSEICRLVRVKHIVPYTYIILLTSKDKKGDVITGLESGADDYLTKPYNHHELKVRLRTGHRILELQDELIQARETIRKIAQHDSLTGIWNRGAIFENLERELARSNREQIPVSIVMVDIDFFKHINDTYGHVTGDAVLKKIAKTMQSSIRLYDNIGRYGGEEFIIVLPNCDKADAIQQAERIRRIISETSILSSSQEIFITISLGVATYTGDPSLSMLKLIDQADQALYQAKKCGRNQVQSFALPS